MGEKGELITYTISDSMNSVNTRISGTSTKTKKMFKVLGRD